MIVHRCYFAAPKIVFTWMCTTRGSVSNLPAISPGRFASLINYVRVRVSRNTAARWESRVIGVQAMSRSRWNYYIDGERTGHRDAIRTRRSMNLFSLYPGICIDRVNFHRGKPCYHVQLFFVYKLINITCMRIHLVELVEFLREWLRILSRISINSSVSFLCKTLFTFFSFFLERSDSCTNIIFYLYIIVKSLLLLCVIKFVYEDFFLSTGRKKKKETKEKMRFDSPSH